MKKVFLILLVLVLSFCAIAQKQDTVVTITGRVASGKPMHLLVERQVGMTQRLVEADVSGEYSITFPVKEPMFLSISIGRQVFSGNLFVAPGAKINLDLTQDEKFQGSYAGVNNLLRRVLAEEFRPKTDGIKTFTKPYAEALYRGYQEREKVIETSGLSMKDQQIVKGYMQFQLLENLYMMILRSKAFGKVFNPPDVAPDYSDPVLNVKWVRELTFTGDWFALFQEWLYAQVRNEKIKIGSRVTYLNDMASVIEDPVLKEAYLLRAIKLELLQGNVKGLEERLQKAKCIVKFKAGKNELAVCAQELKKSVYRDMSGLDFSKYSFPNIHGDTICLSEFKGKYVFVDLWSTGCNPCVAEINYAKRLEDRLKDLPLVWVSISLDTHVDTWKKFVKQKDMDGEQLLCSRAYKHPLMQQMAVHGIPRFIILDPAGKVWDASSRRPSDPVLGELLLKELSGN